MLKNRVIPCLLLDRRRLVKTTKFSRPKYVGDPVNAIKVFNEKEVDELVVLDIGASRRRADPDYEIIGQFAEECFMPLCYGGGVSTLEQAQRLFGLGIEKVCLQTAAMQGLDLIGQIANQYGRQSVVVSIDVKTGWLGTKKLYSAARRRTVAKSWAEHLQTVVAAGAGEIMLMSVDRDGTFSGIDTDLIKLATALVDTPIIAAGGVGSLEHIRTAVDAGASAVGVGSFFVLYGPHRAVLITYPKYAELTALLGS